jgi:hypothetical protein
MFFFVNNFLFLPSNFNINAKERSKDQDGSSFIKLFTVVVIIELKASALMSSEHFYTFLTCTDMAKPLNGAP